jgi:hypothetical protein
MAKRKKAPNATYTYVPSDKPVSTPKTKKTTAEYRKTGGIKKVKTSADKPASRRNIVDPREGKQSDFRSYKSAEEVRTENEGVRLKEAAEVRERKAADKELGAKRLSDLPAYKKDKFASRKAELEASISEVPLPSSRRGKPKKMRAIPAAEAAGPATVPGRGTSAGTPPAKPDRGAEFGGAMVVGKGSGAPDAVTAEGSPSVREMRSKGSIKETSRKAKRRLPGGLKTTEYRPMDIAGRSTSGERKRKRAEAKLAKRVAKGKKGKLTLPKRIGASAIAAQILAKETAQARSPKATVQTPEVSEYTYSDEAMAQQLARTHFREHSATEVMDYVKSTGSDMHSFHKHVTEAHRAATKKVRVGAPGSGKARSAGKITRWSINPKTGEYESASSYEGWQQVNVRGPQGENTKAWKKFEAPKGSLSHIEYLNAQIHKHKERKAIEAKDTRELNRQRREDRATASIAGALSTPLMSEDEFRRRSKSPKLSERPTGTVRVAKKRPKNVEGPSRKDGVFVVDTTEIVGSKPVSVPKAAEGVEQPPRGVGGAYTSTKPTKDGGTTSERVARKRPTFVEVKKPKKRLSLD